jgi:hypothetical protein
VSLICKSKRRRSIIINLYDFRDVRNIDLTKRNVPVIPQFQAKFQLYLFRKTCDQMQFHSGL